MRIYIFGVDILKEMEFWMWVIYYLIYEYLKMMVEFFESILEKFILEENDFVILSLSNNNGLNVVLNVFGVLNFNIVDIEEDRLNVEFVFYVLVVIVIEDCKVGKNDILDNLDFFKR